MVDLKQLMFDKDINQTSLADILGVKQPTVSKLIKGIQEMQKYQYDGIPLYKAMEAVIRKVKMSDYMSAVETVSKLRVGLQKKKKGEERDEK